MVKVAGEGLWARVAAKQRTACNSADGPGIKGLTTLPSSQPEAQTRNSYPVSGDWAVSYE
jgi:hypothetical protein